MFYLLIHLDMEDKMVKIMEQLQAKDKPGI